MATFPIDLALSVAVGASVSLVSRGTTSEYRLLRSPALWSLVAFQVLVYAPVGAYLLWRFPAWSLMYFVEVAELPFEPAYLAGVHPVIAVGSFLVCRRLVLRFRVAPVVAILVFSLGSAGAIGFLGQAQLSVVGTTAAFRADPGSMRALAGSTLGWVAGGGLAAVLFVWGATLWRLAVLVRVMRTGALEAVAGEVRANAQPDEEIAPRPRRTRKKA